MVNEHSRETFNGENGERSQEFPSIQLDVLHAATNHFSDENKLGQGGFGPVYKGTLADGKEIAVKRLSETSSQGLVEFKNEIMLIAKLQHRNLVRLLGCCLEKNEKLLVYEFMPNKSLDVFLFDSKLAAQLDWQKRFNIIKGIARGILYLHEDSRLKIIHRDLKASNVLLDHEMNPKISDFGMARIFEDKNEANTNRVVGTYFGVLLLEIISGKKNNGFHHLEHGESLLTFAWKLWSKGEGMELIDQVLVPSCVASEVLKCIHIGLLCVQEDPADRPTMSSVIFMLASDSTRTLLCPSEPAFSVGRAIAKPTEPISDDGVFSVNERYWANIIGNYTANSAYERDLNSIFKEITSITKSNYGFYSNKVGEVNAMALCRAGLTFTFLVTFAISFDPYFLHSCANNIGNYTANSAYERDLNTIFKQITSITKSNYGFYSKKVGEVNAMALCRADVKLDVCTGCLNETISRVKLDCPNNKEAIGWSADCTLRYSNTNLSEKLEINPQTCLYNTGSTADEYFQLRLGELLSDLRNKAASGGALLKYAAGNSSLRASERLYALVQCTPDLSEGDCNHCLDKAATNGILRCCLKQRGCRVLSPSCNLRFETYPFVEAGAEFPPPPSPSGDRQKEEEEPNKSKRTPVLVASLSVIFGVAVVSISGFLIWKRRNNQDTEYREIQLLDLVEGRIDM
ncbi:hypothetical protein Gotri_003274 [Gossypium trilobum]|uniref:non-specific serine/threonine protein kinase n=1 Tax=Gossypium trilobum TaxID=34281 RepID=A0A7J9F108_9ROSI|nr:hypothetical protein [Gossypium trilobum]